MNISERLSNRKARLSQQDLLELRKLDRSEVIKLPDAMKMLYFFSLQAKHIKLERVAKDLLRLLCPHNEIGILSLVGATGVGKTTLVVHLINSIIYESKDANDSDSIPLIYIAIAANGEKSISWTTIYEKILNKANEILIEKKQSSVNDGKVMSINPRRFKTLAALRESVESMLTNRKVQLLVLDEAVHLLRFGSYSAIMDTIKSLCDQSQTKILMIGSFDLIDLATDYAQVARRSEILHFERYYKDRNSDRRQFKILVAKLQKCWPCIEVPNFVAISNELLDVSLGCVGLLKALMLGALSQQLANNGKWHVRMLSKAAKSVKALEKIRIEIENGEKKALVGTYGQSIFSGEYLKKLEAKMHAK